MFSVKEKGGKMECRLFQNVVVKISVRPEFRSGCSIDPIPTIEAFNTGCWQEAAGGPMGWVLDPPLSMWE